MVVVVMSADGGCNSNNNNNRVQVLLLYASQTGNAQSIAEDLNERLISDGITVELKCFSQTTTTTTTTTDILCTTATTTTTNNTTTVSQKPCCLVIIASTTGDGDPPDSAHKLWKQLKSLSGSPLVHLSYTVLGLGDTNYTNFCNFGKNVDKQLQTLGAQRFYRCGWADDGTGLEEVVEPWCDGLIIAIKLHLSRLSMQVSTSLNSTRRDLDYSDAAAAAAATKNRSNGGNGSQNLPRTACNTEEPNGDQEYKGSVRENNNDTEMSVTNENEDMVSEIMAGHSIDVLPQHEMEGLPVRCCALPKDDALSIPALPAPYINLTFSQDSQIPSTYPTSSNLPCAASEVVKAKITNIRQLTHPTAVKTTLEYTLALPTEGFDYLPGDSIAIIVKNTKVEVELLLELLGVRQTADKVCELSIIPNTKKRAAVIPSYLPHKSTIRHILEYCLDIRAVPKKPFLRALAEHTTKSCEQRRLLELASKQGGEEYTRYVRQACLSTVDLLLFFRSCRPPVTTLLEHLPRLLPRPYSAASSPLATPNSLTFTFNVVNIPQGSSVAFSRQGICTGWLASLQSNKCDGIKPTTTPSVPDVSELEEPLSSLSLDEHKDECIDIYLRSNQCFRPHIDSSTPVVMVGPGTGVAPFLGFLKHRQKLGVLGADWWLFFGCRHKDKDFLYQEELKEFESEGVLNHLIVSYSRESDGPKYVQDNIIKYGSSLCHLLEKGIVYVCGDAKNMAKDVFEAFVTILRNYNNLTEPDARKFITKMQIDKRYLQDVWT